MSKESKSISIPKWDRKAESYPIYLAKLQALVEYNNCVDVLDEIEMKKCPNVSSFKMLLANPTPSKSEEKQIELFKQNK